MILGMEVGEPLLVNPKIQVREKWLKKTSTDFDNHSYRSRCTLVGQFKHIWNYSSTSLFIPSSFIHFSLLYFTPKKMMKSMKVSCDLNIGVIFFEYFKEKGEKNVSLCVWVWKRKRKKEREREREGERVRGGLRLILYSTGSMPHKF